MNNITRRKLGSMIAGGIALGTMPVILAHSDAFKPVLRKCKIQRKWVYAKETRTIQHAPAFCADYDFDFKNSIKTVRIYYPIKTTFITRPSKEVLTDLKNIYDIDYEKHMNIIHDVMNNHRMANSVTVKGTLFT
jgi:hypothetical protein